MERLLLLRLRSVGCAAEARINDIPVARTPRGGGAANVPVHEYLLEGSNHIALAIEPGWPGVAAAPRLAEATTGASLRLLLPRIGQLGSELNARTLADLDWAVPEGEIYAPQVAASRSIELPIKFPRWRWLDLQPVADLAAAQPVVARFVQNLAIALAKGDADAFLIAARLRFEELAQAYQKPAADLAARWRSRIQLLHATKALKPVLPALPEVLLRPCAGGRLLECVAASGEPSLRTEAAADGTRQAWPIRVAVVEGHCHILR
jgi:hypothetical protein